MVDRAAPVRDRVGPIARTAAGAARPSDDVGRSIVLVRALRPRDEAIEHHADAIDQRAEAVDEGWRHSRRWVPCTAPPRHHDALAARVTA